MNHARQIFDSDTMSINTGVTVLNAAMEQKRTRSIFSNKRLQVQLQLEVLLKHKPVSKSIQTQLKRPRPASTED